MHDLKTVYFKGLCISKRCCGWRRKDWNEMGLKRNHGIRQEKHLAPGDVRNWESSEQSLHHLKSPTINLPPPKAWNSGRRGSAARDGQRPPCLSSHNQHSHGALWVAKQLPIYQLFGFLQHSSVADIIALILQARNPKLRNKGDWPTITKTWRNPIQSQAFGLPSSHRLQSPHEGRPVNGVRLILRWGWWPS